MYDLWLCRKLIRKWSEGKKSINSMGFKWLIILHHLREGFEKERWPERRVNMMKMEGEGESHVLMLFALIRHVFHSKPMFLLMSKHFSDIRNFQGYFSMFYFRKTSCFLSHPHPLSSCPLFPPSPSALPAKKNLHLTLKWSWSHEA